MAFTINMFSVLKLTVHKKTTTHTSNKTPL